MPFLRIRLGLMIALLSLSAAADAQNCSFDVDKKDAFSNQRRIASTIRIGPKVLNDEKHLGFFWTMTMERNGEDYKLSVLVTLFGKRDGVFEKGQKMLAKLSDGSIIEFIVAEDILPSYITNSTGNGFMTQLDLKFASDRKTLKKLSRSPISALRFSLGSHELNAEIDEKHGDKISRLATCIVEN